jgi:hypothetical protein
MIRLDTVTVKKGAKASLTVANGVVRIPRSRIVRTADFQVRHRLSDEHARSLVTAIRNGADIPPIIVWEDAQRTDGKLVLLDGAHRLAAYTKVLGRSEVQATIFRGERADALLRCVEANSTAALPMTLPEKMDWAWKLVRETGKTMSKAQIARGTNVSPRSVATMRKLWAELNEIPEMPKLSGSWWADRNAPSKETAGESLEMTDMQRQTAIREMAKAFAQAAGQTPKRDIQLLADALQEAVGDRVMQDVMDYLYGPTDNDFDKTAADGIRDVSEIPGEALNGDF